MKKRYAKLNRGRLRRCTYIKDQLQGEKNSRKGKQKNKFRNNIIGLKNYNYKKEKWEKNGRRKKKGEKASLQFC